MDNKNKLSNGVIGLVVLGASITGVVSFLLSLVTFSDSPGAAGQLLIAAALSFGLLANAVLR